jgi:hypothetical protein
MRESIERLNVEKNLDKLFTDLPKFKVSDILELHSSNNLFVD